MKKILAMLLTITMCISMAACGGADPKAKEAELVASTPMLNLDELWYSMYANEASAKMNYDGKMFQVKVTVLNIGTNSFEYIYKDDWGSTHFFEVYLPTETLATLTSGEHITVLGELKLSGSGASLHNAFIVDDSNSPKLAFDDETVQEAIDNYHPDKHGDIDWNSGSCPFFIDNRQSFEKLTPSTFFGEMEGQWIGREYVGSEDRWSFEFTSDSTLNASENDSDIYEWRYEFEGESLKFPYNSSKSYEVRKVSDRLIVFYASTIDYVPYWILYKE